MLNPKCFRGDCTKPGAAFWINSKGEHLPVCDEDLRLIMAVHNGKLLEPGTVHEKTALGFVEHLLGVLPELPFWQKQPWESEDMGSNYGDV